MELYFKGKKYDLDNAIIENCVELSKLHTAVLYLRDKRISRLSGDALKELQDKIFKAYDEKFGGVFSKNNIGIAVLCDDISVEALDELQMNNLGWYRKDTIKDLYKVPSY